MSESPANTANTMTLARFRELLDAYGAEPARWPEAERAAATQLMAREPEALQLRAAALSLDGLLDLTVVPEASAGLRARVAEVPIREGRQARASVAPWLGFRVWQMVLAGAMACLVGVISGSWSPDAPDARDATDDSGTSSAANNDDGWDDVASVAFASGAGEEL